MSTGPCPITSSLNPHLSAGRYKYGISFAAPDQTLSHSWFKSQIPSSLLSRETFLTLISGRMAPQRSVSPFFTPHFFLSSFLKRKPRLRSSAFRISSTSTSVWVQFWGCLACWKWAAIFTCRQSPHLHSSSLYYHLFFHFHLDSYILFFMWVKKKAACRFTSFNDSLF